MLNDTSTPGSHYSFFSPNKIRKVKPANQEVNPNRVYVMGYSAGGDGAYQIIPRMTLHVDGLDAAYNRNTLAVDFGKQIQKLPDAETDLEGPDSRGMATWDADPGFGPGTGIGKVHHNDYGFDRGRRMRIAKIATGTQNLAFRRFYLET